MKLGVSLSGCGVCGTSAHRVLDELKQLGLPLTLISACSVPCVTALPYARGQSLESLDLLASKFCADVAENGMNTAIKNISGPAGESGDRPQIPFILNAYDLEDGSAVAFTDDFEPVRGPVRILPMGDLYDMFSASIGGAHPPGRYRIPGCGLTLCDYGARFGCPTAPLRMMGMERVLSVAFLPGTPSDAYETLIRQSMLACPASDLHIAVEYEPNPTTQAGDAAAPVLDGLRRELAEKLDRLLF